MVVAAMRCVLPPPQSVGSGSPTEHPRREHHDAAPATSDPVVQKTPGAATRTSVPGATAVHIILNAIPRAARLLRSPFGRSTAAMTPARTSTAANDTLLSTRSGC